MLKHNLWMCLLVCALIFASVFGENLVAAQANGAKTAQDIQVDIPVVLADARIVFDIGRVTFAGDMPVALHFMDIMADRFAEQGTKGKIVGIFYGDATYLILNDTAYNSRRRVSTGNPYKELIMGLLRKGVQLEVCANAMRLQTIYNAELLHGIKVNSGANLRMVQLMQEGFQRLQP